MPYAAPGQVGHDPIEGGIEISDDQYREAIAGMMDGKEVTILGGSLVIDFPPEPQSEDPTIEQITTANITSAPDTLFGGPTLKEIFDGH